MKRILLAALLSFFVPTLPVLTGEALAVSTADEICAPTADPCVISSTFTIDSGSTLDFGLRTVQISGGQLDSGAGIATLICGEFLTDTGTQQAIKARGPSGLGSTDGGVFNLIAQRACSGATEMMCTAASDCNFGACSGAVCSGNGAISCTSDASCDLGTCNADRCSNNASVTCASDADCNVGTCSVTVCQNRPTQTCSIDSDCDFGTCSAGADGTITTNRKVRADGATAGDIIFRAAGDITVNDLIDADSSDNDSSGGTIDLESGLGTIRINADLDAAGGNFDSGGDIFLVAGVDVVINSSINSEGGDFDGGFIEIDAAQDILIADELTANSVSGEGFGGEVTLTATRDIIFSGTKKITVNGNMSDENSGGDGGALCYTAGRNIEVREGVTMEANGAQPDGVGGTIEFDAGGNLEIDGDLEAKASDGGSFGGGGSIFGTVVGNVDIGSSSRLDTTGKTGGGDIDIECEAVMNVSGTLDPSANATGIRGSVSLEAVDNMNIDGTIITDGIGGEGPGSTDISIDIEACRVALLSGASIDNSTEFSNTQITGREEIDIQAGASVQASDGTENVLVYRDNGTPPVINGTVDPSPVSILDATLSPCPICGNNVNEDGETCDDGNNTGGDGCSADCQDEDCIAATPGYPTVPLCDDGIGCTVDTCSEGDCNHVVNCDDGIGCTADACGGDGNCINSPTNAACDDSNECTSDICNATQGCINVAINALCDDLVDCTSNDVCMAGECMGQNNCPGEEFCNEQSGECVVSTTTTTTTIPQLCGNGSVEFPETCDDGDQSWQQGEYCNAECVELECGDTDDTMTVTATDALYVLRAAVGLSPCDACICDVDNSGASGVAITAADALRVLRSAVGVPDALLCGSCPN